MGLFETVGTGLADILLEQIKSRGLVILLLLMLTFGLVYRDNNNLNYVMAENRALKQELKDMRSADVLLIKEQSRQLLENQRQMLEYQRIQAYKQQERNER